MSHRLHKYIQEEGGAFKWDWQPSLQLLVLSLGVLQENLASDKAYSVGAQERADRIRYVITLLKFTMNDDEVPEYCAYDDQREVEGRGITQWLKLDTDQMHIYKPPEPSPKLLELQDIWREAQKQHELQQQKALEIAMKIISKEIKGWWD